MLLTAFSTVVSAAFIFNGVGMTQFDPPIWIKACGYLTILYGTANAIMIAAAWLKMHLNLIGISKYSAIGYMCLALIASLDVGMISGLEWVGLVVVVILLSVNCYTIRYIVKERNMHNQKNAPDQKTVR